MPVRTEFVDTNKPDILGENKDSSAVRHKRLLIAIPSFTGIMNSMAVDGFMRLMGEIANLKEAFEVYTCVPQRTNIVSARNKIVEQAIKQECDWIFWIDDDMVIRPDVNLIEKLMAHNVDIVAPLFFSRCAPYIPMLFQRKLFGTKYAVYDNIMDYPKGLVKVHGIGFGCVLTKVEIFKKLTPPYFWANETFGEDLFFCENCCNNGVDIYVDTTIDVGHIGEPVVSWEHLHIANKQANYDYLKAKNVKDKIDADGFYAELHKNIGKKVDIVMPCYHNADITRDAIESIIKLTEDIDYRIVAVIDGYDKDLIKYFKNKPHIKTILHRQSVGFVKSTNAGIRAVRKNTDCVLLLNNDVVIDDAKWLIKMVNTFDENTGAVAPISDFVMGFQNIGHNNNMPPIHYAKFLIGFCMLVRKDVIDKVGLLDEIFGIGGNDDLDYSIRIRQAGYKLKVNRYSFVHHLGFQSLGKVYKDYKEIEDITRPLLIEKWGSEKVDDLFVMTENFMNKGEG